MNHTTFNSAKIWLTGITLALLLTAFGCKEDKGELALVLTRAASEVNATTARCGGFVSDNGGTDITAKGICWGANPNPTLSSNYTNEGGGIGGFASTLTNLNLATTYYYRAYANNSAGTSYGNEMSFTTQNGIASVIIESVVEIKSTSAKIEVSIPTDGGDPITAKGVCYGTSSLPTLTDSYTTNGIGTDAFTSALAGLNRSTLYYVRAYVTNVYGTYYGDELNFTTNNGLVEITSTYVSFINATTVNARGNITTDGGDPVTERGFCWGTNPVPTLADNHTASGEGIGGFVVSMTGFLPETHYYVRAYATNVLGTTYSNERSFTSYGTMTDIDGNEYLVATINNRKWMAQNLKTTKYNDGTSIPLVTDNAEWAALSTPAYCWYDNDISNKDICGALYNGYTVTTDNLCPTGWHVPSDAEWYAMENYVDPTINDPNATMYRGTYGGYRLKATNGWHYNNHNGINYYGFSAIPGGLRYSSDGSFNLNIYYESHGFWWSSSLWETTHIWFRSIIDRYSIVERDFSSTKSSGMSVRCIKND
jgi:uncharacterized protein (TIGR02145 family)